MSNTVTVTQQDPLNVTVQTSPPMQVTVQAPGIQGPPGADGVVVSYLHNQISASSTWVVNHNLGVVPNVEVRSVGGVVIFAEVLHISNNQTQIIFNEPVAGTARFI